MFGTCVGRLVVCPRRSAKFVLQEMGQISLSLGEDENNRIVVVNALKDNNSDVAAQTMRLFSKRMLLRNISIGAGRPVRVYKEESYKYFKKIVSALSIGAK